MVAQADAKPQDDQGNEIVASFYELGKYPKLSFTVDVTPISLTDSINPASPNFMRWYDPKPPAAPLGDKCHEPVTFSAPKQAQKLLGEFLYGLRPPAGCGLTASQFQDADWSDWRMVNIRQPKDAAEART